MKILLTNNHMRNFGGSELVTLELAEEYQRQGHEVLIYSPLVGGQLDITVPHTNIAPDTSSFDLIWIHHNLLVYSLAFKKRDSQRVIFNHMSSYVNLEWPRMADYENKIADMILCNSEETREVLESKGLTGVKLFQNPAPLSFWGQNYGREGVIISNHPPAELRPLGLAWIGGPAGERVSGTKLRSYSFVVCNGKTVQYALRAGVPVYLYDHFGGPGWLTSENFNKAEFYNFSGRGFDKKTTEQIRLELANVPQALPCPDRFKFEVKLKELGLC